MMPLQSSPLSLQALVLTILLFANCLNGSTAWRRFDDVVVERRHGSSYSRLDECSSSSSNFLAANHADTYRVNKKQESSAALDVVLSDKLRGGGAWSWYCIPPGWNPFGYKITELGEQFLSYEGALDGVVGRFLASLKDRKTRESLKENWVEVVRVAKTAQAMSVLRQLDELIAFCIKAGFLN